MTFLQLRRSLSLARAPPAISLGDECLMSHAPVCRYLAACVCVCVCVCVCGGGMAGRLGASARGKGEGEWGDDREGERKKKRAWGGWGGWSGHYRAHIRALKQGYNKQFVCCVFVWEILRSSKKWLIPTLFSLILLISDSPVLTFWQVHLWKVISYKIVSFHQIESTQYANMTGITRLLWIIWLK